MTGFHLSCRLCLAATSGPACSLPAPCFPLLSFLGLSLSRGRGGTPASDLLPAGDPTAVSSLCFFQVWGQILTAIACPLPSLLPPSPPSPLPPVPAGTWRPLAPGSLTASSVASWLSYGSHWVQSELLLSALSLQDGSSASSTCVTPFPHEQCCVAVTPLLFL